MKKMKFLLVACAALVCQLTQAQTLKEFFADGKTPLTYLGADFTATRYLGETALVTTDFKNKVVPSINDVVVNEAKKFDIAGSFRRESVKNDLAQVTKQNAGLDETKLKSDNASDFERLKQADVDKIAGKYSGKGIGLLFIVEALDKSAKKAAVWAVVVDLDKKKVLLSKRYTEEGKGFGMRNYWVHSIYEVLDDIDSHDYKSWKNSNS